MNRVLPIALGISLAGALLFPAGADDSAPPTRAEIEGMMGLPSDGERLRGVRDTVGFVVGAEQAEELIGRAIDGESLSLQEQDRRLGMSAGRGFIGGICPHDDHLYAAPVYVHLTERITAPRVLLIGVFHGARRWHLENRLVFDAFDAWHAPWAPVPVDPLRQELLEALPADDVIVDNGMHDMEHSLEAILPFLQHRNRDVRIVPILVPYMGWEQLQTLSDHLASALSTLMIAHGWELGRDLAVVISSDAVHYGEDFDYAPFGTDAEAYLRAVEQDHALIEEHLAGPLRAEALEGLLHELVDKDDVRRYRIPWCGRFSIPFGLELLRKTAAALGMPVPAGYPLRYGSSLSEPEPVFSDAARRGGLGYTAPSNFHHWVGYAAVGYLFDPVTPPPRGD